MRILIRTLPSILLVSAACLPSARADEVYGNSTLARPNGGNAASANFNNQRIQAINFNTGTSSLLGIDQGWVLLRNSTGNTVNFTVDIYASVAVDSVTNPGGSSLGSASLAVVNDGADSWRNFSFSSTVTLSAGTDYWLVINHADTTVAVNWLKPGSTTSTYGEFNGSGYAQPSGLLRANSSNGGTTWNTGGPAEMGFQLSAVAVPEPSTEALAAVGLGIASFVMRFRRRN